MCQSVWPVPNDVIIHVCCVDKQTDVIGLATRVSSGVEDPLADVDTGVVPLFRGQAYGVTFQTTITVYGPVKFTTSTWIGDAVVNVPRYGPWQLHFQSQASMVLGMFQRPGASINDVSKSPMFSAMFPRSLVSSSMS